MDNLLDIEDIIKPYNPRVDLYRQLEDLHSLESEGVPLAVHLQVELFGGFNVN